jgi:hypothetical protein
MKKEFKKNLQKGRIYLRNGVWVVRYETKERVGGGSPKQLGSYRFQTKVNFVPIRVEDTHNLRDPYDQGKETCFELILINEIENGYKNQPPGIVGFVAETKPVWYAKLWSTSEWVQNFQYYLETTPQEQIDKDWEKTKQLDMNNNNVKPHKIFIKGKKYQSDNTLILCTKTTCNYSTEHFQGVVLESREYAIGKFSKTWRPSVFEEVVKEKVGY